MVKKSWRYFNISSNVSTGWVDTEDGGGGWGSGFTRASRRARTWVANTNGPHVGICLLQKYIPSTRTHARTCTTTHIHTLTKRSHTETCTKFINHQTQMVRTPHLDRNLMNSMQYAICSNKHRTSVGKGLIFLCRACPRLWVHSISAKLAQLGLETIGFK